MLSGRVKRELIALLVLELDCTIELHNHNNQCILALSIPLVLFTMMIIQWVSLRRSASELGTHADFEVKLGVVSIRFDSLEFRKKL